MTTQNTTEHAWTREQVATYLAGGLAGDERARFEDHIGSCGSCLEELQDAQAVERTLAAAFAKDRPSPWLEDKILRTIRSAPRPRLHLSARFLRIASSVAAVLLLAIVGFYAEGLLTGRQSEGHGPVYGFGSGRAPAAPSIQEAGRYSSVSTTMKRDAATRLPSAAEMAGTKATELDKLSAGANTLSRNLEVQTNPVGDTPSAERPAEDRRVADHIESADSENRLKGDWYFKPGAEAAKSGPDSVLARKDPDEASKAEWKKQDPGTGKPPQPAQDPQPSRKIIRKGEMEFEVDGFDSSVATVLRIAEEEKSTIATVNSDRLPNGKVRGTIVLRVPPDNLDRLVLKLRGLGELKSQRITSEDITKRYTDLEGHLRAARAMESRLIDIIKSGKGEIKDILLAEKELGVWREKIELLEGELRFYANLVSLSTLTLTLAERDIRSPSLVTVTETVDTGIESEDVLKADKDLRTLIADAKARITSSDLKKLAADQFSLMIVCEAPPENAGRLRDSLATLGRIARLDVQTHTSDDGRGRPVDGKVKRLDTVFRISVYNTTNVQPRETSHLNLACLNVEEAFRTVISSVREAGGRVVQSNLNRPKGDQIDAVIQFDVPADRGAAIQKKLESLGAVISFKVAENPDSANVTKSKKGFQVLLLALSHVGARETATLAVVAKDVDGTYRRLQEFAVEKGGRVLDARLNEARRDQKTASLDLEIPRTERTAFEALLKNEGEILTQSSLRAPDDGRVVDTKIRFVMSLQTIASVGPRRVVKLAIEVSDVDSVSGKISRLANGVDVQIVDSQNSRMPNGRAISFLALEAPVDKLAGLVEQIRKSGTVRMEENRRNPGAPEGELAIGRIDVTISNEDPIVGGDAGFGAQIRDALRSVFAAAGWSLKLILIGGLIVVPWVLIAWAGWKLVRRMRAKPAVGV